MIFTIFGMIFTTFGMIFTIFGMIFTIFGIIKKIFGVIIKLLGMIITDMSVPGCPIVHLNEGFTNMTGYGNEKLGTNCKFLQVGTVRTDRVQSL